MNSASVLLVGGNQVVRICSEIIAEPVSEPVIAVKWGRGSDKGCDSSEGGQERDAHDECGGRIR